VLVLQTHGMPSHLNVEIKARCNDPEAVLQPLQRLGAVLQGVDRQVDTYFRAATGRLKLRSGNIENSLIHYRREDRAGPKDSQVTLIETRSEESAALRSLLAGALGIVIGASFLGRGRGSSGTVSGADAAAGHLPGSSRQPSQRRSSSASSLRLAPSSRPPGTSAATSIRASTGLGLPTYRAPSTAAVDASHQPHRRVRAPVQPSASTCASANARTRRGDSRIS